MHPNCKCGHPMSYHASGRCESYDCACARYIEDGHDCKKEKCGDGGPAFPSPLEWRETRIAQGDETMVSGVYDNAHDGMSLRDYFAAKAPEAPTWWLSCQSYADPSDTKAMIRSRNRWAYDWAEGMVAERERRKAGR